MPLLDPGIPTASGARHQHDGGRLVTYFQKDEQLECFSTRVQLRNKFRLLAVSLSKWSDFSADAGTLPDKTWTKRSHTQLHKFFVKGTMVAPLTTAGVSDEVADVCRIPRT